MADPLDLIPAGEMPPRTRPLKYRPHEAFCRAVAMGMHQLQAYKQFVATDPEPHIPTLWTQSSILARRHRPRIADLRARVLARSEDKWLNDKAKAIRFAWDIVDTPLDAIEAGSPLIQERTTVPTKDGDRVTVKMPAKLDALHFLSKVSGWDAPQHVQVTHSIDESQAIRLLRQRFTRVKETKGVSKCIDSAQTIDDLTHEPAEPATWELLNAEAE